MNKKGHHELGNIPYVIIGGLVGFLVLYGKKIYRKIKKIKK